MSKKNRAPDKSVKTPQREKIKEQFEIREYQWTEKQKRFIDLCLHKDTRIVICKAPPGVGKTLLSVYCSLIKLRDKKVGEIIYIRNPVESSSKGVGFLAGSLDQKLDAWAGPLKSCLNELVSSGVANSLINDKRVRVESIGFIKGTTFSVSSVIADEIEDFQLIDLSLLLTRLGRHSTMFLIGDENQANIRDSGFIKVFNMFNDEESKSHGIHTFEFGPEDCMRSETVRFILSKLGK